jgi:hypothetical protein
LNPQDLHTITPLLKSFQTHMEYNMQNDLKRHV